MSCLGMFGETIGFGRKSVSFSWETCNFLEGNV